jgi:hypothetical protein
MIYEIFITNEDNMIKIDVTDSDNKVVWDETFSEWSDHEMNPINYNTIYNILIDNDVIKDDDTIMIDHDNHMFCYKHP